MKGLKLTLVLSLAALALMGLSQMTFAFHDGGVAYCAGCHTMHAQVNGSPSVTGAGNPSFLLKTTKPSDVCIGCHSYQLTADGSGNKSGGDFFWVQQNYTVSYPGHSGPSTKAIVGQTRGHNVISDSKNIVADSRFTNGPGGSFPSARLGCNSCHDPHGKGGHPVLLWGAGDTQKYLFGDTGYQFANPEPVLVNAGRKTNVTDTNHSAYGSGMSLWCANCHAGLYNTGGAVDKHKVDIALGGTFSANYNNYLLKGSAGPADSGTSYLEPVPFETGTTDVTTLSTSSTAGPDSASKVMCLTCHRSHSSPWNAAARWDFSASLLAEAIPGPEVTGVTVGTVTLAAAQTTYGRPAWNAEQRSLCNKCHVKDY